MANTDLIDYVVHDAEGAITKVGVCVQTDLALMALEVGQGDDPATDAGRTAIEYAGADIVAAETHYVTGGVVTARPVITGTPDKTTFTADGVDKVLFSELIQDMVMMLDGATAAGTVQSDGSFDIFATDVGTYTIKASLWPYIDKEWVLTAT